MRIAGNHNLSACRKQIVRGEAVVLSPFSPRCRQAVEAVGQQGGYAGLGDNLVCEPSAAPHGLDLLFGLQNSNKSACHKQGGAALYQVSRVLLRCARSPVPPCSSSATGNGD